MNPHPMLQRKDRKDHGSIIFLSHGGGPLPLLGEPGHRELVDFLQEIPASLINPTAIVVISAHWEKSVATVTHGKAPELFFDYYGFPEQAYTVSYPAPGAPELAEKVHKLLQSQGITAALDDRRGFDHGVFIPLKIMYPQAHIPCIQVSLLDNLRPEDHIQLGRALSQLSGENLLIIGSGSSFHNLRAFRQAQGGDSRQDNETFEAWLRGTLSDETLDEQERQRRLLLWDQAPAARYCHPREEHLLPLHVCYGIAGRPADRIYKMELMGKTVSACIW